MMISNAEGMSAGIFEKFKPIRDLKNHGDSKAHISHHTQH